MTPYSLAVAAIGGIITVVGLVCVTVLIADGHKIPPEMWTLLSVPGSAAVIGGSVATGAAITSRQSMPNIDRFYQGRMKGMSK